MMLEIRAFQEKDTASVLQLWNDCELTMPYNNPNEDIRRKLAVQPELFLVGTVNSQIVACVMAGYEGHRGWLNYLAVSPSFRRQGFARQMVAAAEKQLGLLGCPKINLQVRVGNTQALDFYRKIGFKVDQVISLGKRLDVL